MFLAEITIWEERTATFCRKRKRVNGTAKCECSNRTHLFLKTFHVAHANVCAEQA
jgi:hypothetical protein